MVTDSRAQLQGLTVVRGLAAMYVVVYHFEHHFQRGLSHLGPVDLVGNGYLAVDIFFVLSGVVITLAYEELISSGELKYANFMLRRLARLYPLHLLFTVSSLAIGVASTSLFGQSTDAYTGPGDLAAHLLLLHSFGLPSELVLNYPSWSISAEFAAYAVAPFVILALTRLGRPKLAATASLGTLVVFAGLQSRFTSEPFTSLTTLGVVRVIPEFTVGVAIGLTLLSNRRSETPRRLDRRRYWYAAELVSIGLLVSPQVESEHIKVLSAVAVVYAAAQLSAVGGRRRLRSTHPLIKLGEWSFAIYLSHSFVERVGFQVIEALGAQRSDQVSTWWALPMLAATVLVGFVVHEGVEKPIYARLVANLPPLRSGDHPAARGPLRIWPVR